MKELSETNPELAKTIIELTEFGNSLAESEKYNEALANYKKAWNQLPKPETQWEMLPYWISKSCFRSHFMLGEFEEAKKWAEITLQARSSDIDTAPLINLGMVNFELGEQEEALKYFKDAYKYGKNRAFQGRPKKYLDFYLKHIKA